MPLPKMKQPDFEVHTYPPSGFIDKKEASAGVSWADLGKARGKTAWDVIFFNFRTLLPEEVNWYMWHYLGRTKLASDGINMTFGVDPSNPSSLTDPPLKFHAGDRPWVYIPPAGFKAPSVDDETLRASVMWVLSQIEANIQFRFGRAALFPGEIFLVRNLIAARRIGVQYDSSLNGIAKYVHPNSAADGNTIMAGFTKTTTVWERALIVHEAAHAAFDVRGTRTRSRQAEAVAYVAQAIYLIRNKQTPHLVDLPANFKDIFIAAEQVATWVISLHTPPPAVLFELSRAIRVAYPTGVYAYDGVP